MGDPMKQAWNDVGEDFSRLGKVMKDRYEGHGSSGAPDTDRVDADEGVRAAFERLLAAGREFGDRIANVMTGEEVRAQAKQTEKRLNEAMMTTAELLGDQIRGVFKGVARRSDPVDTVVEDVQAQSDVDPAEPNESTGQAPTEPHRHNDGPA